MSKHTYYSRSGSNPDTPYYVNLIKVCLFGIGTKLALEYLYSAVPDAQFGWGMVTGLFNKGHSTQPQQTMPPSLMMYDPEERID